ncbi:MAG: hypothetical protein [Olavius algarvensis Delta 4 endosymbiont]|nr:MAG: hypothetical protein [Olavius algarvensis Delta 4 endosymbiont]
MALIVYLKLFGKILTFSNCFLLILFFSTSDFICGALDNCT